MKTVSVVVPVYWNEGSLPELAAELAVVEQKLSGLGLALELIFVDDGSGDGSFAEIMKIKAARPATKAIKLTRNFGAVHASKTGMQFVTGEAFLVLAADLQDPPSLVLDMVARWQEGARFVLCARQKRDDPLLSRLFAAIYYAFLRYLVVSDYPKGGYDLALMDKRMLPYLVNSAKNVNTPLFATWLGFKPVILPYQRRVRRHGKSRWTFAKKVKFFLDSLLGFSIVPIRAILLVGMFVACASVAYGSWIVVSALLGKQDVRGFATIISFMSFLFGLVIVMLGIIGEYVWRIYDEVNKRPETVIEEVF